MDEIVVYRAPGRCDIPFIDYYLRRNRRLWIIELFPIFRREDGGVYLPQPPPRVQELIKAKKISVLRTEEIKAKEIYLWAANRAVASIEAVYPAYRERYEETIRYAADTLQSATAENAFKINLCGRLAEFYCINLLLDRVEKYFNMRPILACPNINVQGYSFIREMLVKSNQEFSEHPNIRFPLHVRSAGFLENCKEKLVSISMIGAQALGSTLLGKFTSSVKKRRYFKYGVAIISPRQFRENKRGMDFIIDNRKILPQEVAFFPMMELSEEMKEKAARSAGEIIPLPQRGTLFSHSRQWRALLRLSLKHLFCRDAEEMRTASLMLFTYFKWQKVLEGVGLRHFITHSDFGVGHMGRNIALKQAGVQTWYFIDSIAYELNYRKDEGHGMLFPFWTYLYYDHLVSSHAALCRYLKEHPDSFRDTHVVGSLWGAHITDRNTARKDTAVSAFKHLDNYFVIACFDSTYLMNAHISYAGGIAFAMHLLDLVNEYPDIHILFKEKKDRGIHRLLDPILGPELVGAYEKMDLHPRITTFTNQSDASEIISVSDLVITFPFTSTTFEALSRNKPAIWHDPLGDYKKTLYAKVEGVTTHGYEELTAKVKEIKTMQQGTYQNPIPVDSPLMDPFRDGRAIDRFRDLLVSN